MLCVMTELAATSGCWETAPPYALDLFCGQPILQHVKESLGIDFFLWSRMLTGRRQPSGTKPRPYSGHLIGSGWANCEEITRMLNYKGSRESEEAVSHI